MDQREEGSLRIGYLMQNGAPDLREVSGPQLHTVAVIKGLQKLGHTVRTVATQREQLLCSDDLNAWHRPDYGFSRKKWFRFLESAVRRVQSELKLPFLGLFDSLHTADAFSKQLKGFDVLYERHGYMGFGGVFAARWLKIPLVLELNGNIIREIDERGLNISPLQRKIGRWITIQTFHAVNHIVVVSDALRHTLVTEYQVPAEKISVVLNGVNLDLFTKTYEKQKILREYGLSDIPTVVFVGSFEPWHGVEFLLASFPTVVKNCPNVQLVLVGEGSGKEKAVQQAASLNLTDKIKFLGRLPQDQVAAVLSASNIVVAPYPFEHSNIVGTPLKLLEYMAAGKGIVASTAPIHEIVEDGVTGIRVAPANADALAAGITNLLADPLLCESLGRKAALKAQKYSWDSVNFELGRILLKECSLK
jgi:glycosyltransferase involved in cell wall biosynthesis